MAGAAGKKTAAGNAKTLATLNTGTSVSLNIKAASSGQDINLSGGLAEYAQDIVYVGWLVLAVSPISAWINLVWLIVIAYALVKLAPFFFGGSKQPEIVEPEVEEKKPKIKRRAQRY